jgi:3-hydroxyisobutyrate dehydrogenase-like beta-hydroxyacid dehydrogenase
VTFTPALRLKDIEYALRLAKKLGVHSPLGLVADELYRKLCAQGGGGDNESRIIDVMRSL